MLSLIGFLLHNMRQFMGQQMLSLMTGRAEVNSWVQFDASGSSGPGLNYKFRLDGGSWIDNGNDATYDKLFASMDDIGTHYLEVKVENSFGQDSADQVFGIIPLDY